MTTDRKPMCDNDILHLLADQRGRGVSEMAAHFHVTQTAIRGRLLRLTLSQSITRQQDGGQHGRGRPRYLYFLAKSTSPCP